MNSMELILLVIALVTGLVGLLFILLPDRIREIEQLLNASWGNRELASLRAGLKGEQALEQVLNRPLSGPTVTWDGWARRYPRLVGMLLCLLALGLWWTL